VTRSRRWPSGASAVMRLSNALDRRVPLIVLACRGRSVRSYVAFTSASVDRLCSSPCRGRDRTERERIRRRGCSNAHDRRLRWPVCVRVRRWWGEVVVTAAAAALATAGLGTCVRRASTPMRTSG
jgi:hypothetical protein